MLSQKVRAPSFFLLLSIASCKYTIVLFFYFYYFYFFIDFQMQLSPFSHHHFPPPYPCPLSTLNLTPHWLCTWVPHTCSFTSLSLLSHVISLPLTLWLLSVYCQFQHLWLYLACQFVLLIRFQLQVR